MVENMDQTDFTLNMENHKTQCFRRSNKVNYPDLVSGCDGFIMVSRLRGEVDTKLIQLFLIFKNRDRNYPLANLPKNIDGASYRTHPCARMDQTVFEEWLHEPPAIDRDVGSRTRHLSMDNCSGYKQTENVTCAFLSTNTEIEFIPRSAMHFYEP